MHINLSNIMGSYLITIFLAFLEGLALILSPCILPILPIILASSLTYSKKRPLGIITGFALTFAVFSYFAHNLVRDSGIDLNRVRHGAYIFLLLSALILISTHLSELFNRLTKKIAALGTQSTRLQKASDGFFSGLFLGAVISLIWTPCAGPILAAVIVQIAIQKETLISLFILFSFALGAGIPMLLIVFYSLKFRDSLSFFKKHTLFIRKILGVVIILNVAYMMYQESSYNTSSTTISQSGIKTSNYLQDSLWRFYTAPQISGIDAWINSAPLQIADLKGKVVLIDFWTYSCINCIRSLPYLNYWYKTYHDKGLIIIGIHTPEFDFESNLDNVKKAVKQDGIEYPVALDNQFATWSNYSNHYWPAHYLINKDGKVVYKHFGEGDYNVTENNIRFLLGEDYSNQTADFGTPHYSYSLTPETYLGYARANANANPTFSVHDRSALYYFPEKLASNAWALEGEWQVNADKIVATKTNASLEIHFNARKIYIVMGNSGKKPIKAQIKLNGDPLRAYQGKDVTKTSISVDKYSIYQLLDLPKFGSGIIRISPDEPGLEIYTFTFGD